MRRYRVRVLDEDGELQVQEFAARDRAGLQRQLDERAWSVLEVSRVRQRAARIKAEELVLFCQHLQLTLEAGMPVREALDALAEEGEEGAIAALCRRLGDYVDHGESLSRALEQAGLDRFVVAMVSAGETSGRLAEMLARAAAHLQWRHDLRRQVLASLSYPLLVLVSLCIAVPMLFVYLVPQLLSFLAGQNTALPWYTQWLVAVAEFVRLHGAALALVVAGVVASALLLYRVWRGFRRLLDAWSLRLPVLGRLGVQMHAAQFAEQLGILYGAGIPVAQALPVVARSLDNLHLRETLGTAAEQLGEGQGLHLSLESTGFPSLLLRLVKLGELSGRLESSLAQAADLYGRRARRLALRLASVVGPAALLLAGGVILWLVAALILPLYDGLFNLGAGL